MSMAARVSRVTPLVSEVVSWIVRMRVDVPGGSTSDEAERLSALAWNRGSTGVAEVPGSDGTAELLAGFDAESVAREFARDSGGRVERVDPTAWQAPPTTVTTIEGPPTVIIIGVDEPTPDDVATDAVHIRIDAAGAFGHGAHPTTTLALRLLVPAVVAGGAGHRVLDVGAGSGVLGVVAARLGARVSATEIDADAHAVIAANAARNDVDIVLLPVDLGAIEPPELAVVNVLLVVQRELAAAFASMPATGLILTGVLVEQLDELLALHPGRPVHQRLELDGWAAVLLGPDTRVAAAS